MNKYDEAKQLINELIADKEKTEQFKAEIRQKEQKLQKLKAEQEEDFDFERDEEIIKLSGALDRAKNSLATKQRQENHKTEKKKQNAERFYSDYMKQELANDDELLKQKMEIEKIESDLKEQRKQHKKTFDDKLQSYTKYFEEDLGAKKVNVSINEDRKPKSPIGLIKTK